MAVTAGILFLRGVCMTMRAVSVAMTMIYHWRLISLASVFEARLFRISMPVVIVGVSMIMCMTVIMCVSMMVSVAVIVISVVMRMTMIVRVHTRRKYTANNEDYSYQHRPHTCHTCTNQALKIEYALD